MIEKRCVFNPNRGLKSDKLKVHPLSVIVCEPPPNHFFHDASLARQSRTFGEAWVYHLSPPPEFTFTGAPVLASPV